MSEETRVAKKLDKGDVVLIDGVAHEVKKVAVDGKKTTLSLVGPGRDFVRKVVKSKAEMTLDVESPAERAAREKLEARLNSRLRDGSAKRELVEKRAKSKVKDGGGWHEPADKAETRIADIMGGKLVGIETPDGTLVPPLDPSSIKSHLWIFHGLESTTLTYEQLVAAHEEEHARADREPFFTLTIPHAHSNRRPA